MSSTTNIAENILNAGIALRLFYFLLLTAVIFVGEPNIQDGLVHLMMNVAQTGECR